MDSKVNKIKTYVGFAIKSKQIKFGIDEILKNKFLDLILVSSELAESSKSKLENFASKTHSKLIELEQNQIDFVLNKTGVKVFAITNKGLADAIKNL